MTQSRLHDKIGIIAKLFAFLTYKMHYVTEIYDFKSFHSGGI